MTTASGGDRRHAHDHVDLHLAFGEPVVDRLLDQQWHDHAAGGADRREQPRQSETLTQDRRRLEPATDRADRRVLVDRGHRPGLRRQGGVDGHGVAPSMVGSPRGSIGLERLDELPIARGGLHQLVVGPVAGHLTVGHEDDVIGERDRRGSRCDQQHRCLGQLGAEVLQHGRLGRRVERRGRVVQHEQRRLTHQRPRQGQSLPLAAAQAHPPLADHGVQLLREPPDEVVPRRQAQRFPDLVVVEDVAELHVVADGSTGQECLLEHDATNA